MNPSRPTSTRDLAPSERHFISITQEIQFGRFEALPIEHGHLILDPWPTIVREIKFCAKTTKTDVTADDFLLKQHLVELFEYVRSVEVGKIRILEVKNGLPFSMEIEHRASGDKGGQHV